MTKLHVIRKALKSGPRFYVYAWRGGPQIHVQDGTRPVITNDILDKAREARMKGNGEYEGSFEALIDHYLKSPEFTRLAKVTKDDYQRWIGRICERFGTAPIEIMSDFRMKRDITTWRNKWADQPRAADRAIGTLSTILAWASRQGMIATNIAADLGTLHRVDHSDEIWEERHWAAVAEVPAHIMQVLRLGKMTGLRMGDLLALDWSHVGSIAIVVTTSKRRTRATIPIYGDLRAFLDALPHRDGAVLRNSKGEAWTTSGFKSSWSAAKPEGFDRRFHDLRGTCATWLADLDFTDNQIAGIIGWKAARVSEIRARYINSSRNIISLAERMNK